VSTLGCLPRKVDVVKMGRGSHSSQNGQEQPKRVVAATAAKYGRASAFGRLRSRGTTAQKTERPLSDAYEAAVSSQIWVGAFPISACALARFGWVPLPILAGALARFGQKCPSMAILHPITTPPPPSFYG
jgi:hypothetical protein